MPIVYSALKTELQTDPNAYGYAALLSAGNQQGCANALNLVRAAITIDRQYLEAYEIWEAIVPTEWLALNADNKQRISTILGMSKINAKGTNTRAAFLAAFTGGTTTRTNLAALQTRQGSRAEQLFGEGVTVSAADVALALAS
jgi:hypothetical protein